ncbi:MAG: hypothetical protein K8F25_09785, partial [Fimbriimonadaceae bacterium]|nr:hypothetical protein [Alphaproteobacteria bacterium]
ILAQAAIDGMGLTSLPDFIVADGVLSGQLVQISQEPEEKTVPVLAVYPARAHLPLKVRAFIDFLAERLENTSRHAAPSHGFALR